MKTTNYCLLGLLGFFVSVPDVLADNSFQKLLERLPSQANAILLLDADALRTCPLGQREQWAKNHLRDSLTCPTSLSPELSKAVLAAQLNPATLDTTWKLGVGQLQKEATLAQIASAKSGSVDKVGGQPVVLSPYNSYYVPFGPKLVGMMHPANRQELARWLQFTKRNQQTVLSPYLQDAAASVSRKTPVVMAVDMADMLDLDGIKFRLKQNRAVAGQNVNLDQLAQTLAGLKGVKLLVHVEDSMQGELRFDFADSFAKFAPLAKPMILEALDRLGAHIDDLENWQARTEQETVTLSGALTETGLRQLLLPLLTPAARMHSEPATSPGQQFSSDSKAVASQRYFRSVKTLMDDLQKQKVKSYRNLSYLLTKYAQSIDELPLLNVDEELLKYGSWVSSMLRGMAGVAQGTLTQTQFWEGNKVEGQANYWAPGYVYGGGYAGAYGAGYGYGYGYYPASAMVNNFAYISNRQGLAVANDLQVRTEAWKQINQATVQLRQKMTQKYQVEF